MRIWSLLPSATEILFALGLGNQVTGVTHECDYPPEANTKPRVTISNIDSSRSSADIDRQVAQHFESGEKLYGIDEDRLRKDPPDLVITQDLCPVCAVSPSDFADHMHIAGCDARIITLNPNTIEDVFASILQVAEATDRVPQAETYIATLRARLDAVRAATAGLPRSCVLTIEWLDPLMPGGHWVPEMVTIAGGEGGPIEPGQPSRKFTWADLRAINPDIIILMPCGFDPPRGAREAQPLWKLEGWLDLPAVKSGRVYCVDGSSHFSRPGPRLVDGAEILARILHPDVWPHPAHAGLILKYAGMDRHTPVFREYR